jgi:hypothetical protein
MKFDVHKLNVHFTVYWGDLFLGEICNSLFLRR